MDIQNGTITTDTKGDSALTVRFYSRPVRNDFQSIEQARPIFQDVDYVEIFIPGDQNTILDTPVREDHKRRFPIQWAHYQNKHGGDPRINGTPLSQWPLLTPAMAEELKGLKFFTVESIAEASDGNIMKLGMAAGMAPMAFRERAQRYLEAAKGDSLATKQASELAALKAEREAAEQKHQQQIEELRQQMQALMAAKPEPKKRGRPAKESANA